MKKIAFLTFAVLLVTALILPAAGAEFTPVDHQLPLVADADDLLTDAEESALLARCEQITNRYHCEVAIVTISSLDGEPIAAAADDIYDYYGFGYGPGDDGVLLLVAMNEREYQISTYGYGQYAVTDYGIETAANDFVPYLSAGRYADAFDIFLQRMEYYFECAENGQPFDNYYSSRAAEPYKFTDSLPWGLAIGAIIGLVTVTSMKSKLSSVSKQRAASAYVVSNSLNVTDNRDIFLYRTVTKIRRESSSRSGGGGGGGSSSHVSSSGRTHGGGGGHF